MSRVIKGLRFFARKLIEFIENIIHGAIVFGIVVFVFMTIACENIDIDMNAQLSRNLQVIKFAFFNMSYVQVTTCIGAVVIILFGFTSIYDFGYDHGLNILAPPLYRKIQDKNLEKQAHIMMEQYYNNEIANIEEYGKRRSDYVLSSLGLTEKQFSHIRYEIIKARAEKIENENDLIKKTETLIYKTNSIIDLTEIPPSQRKYYAVDYFLDLYSALCDSEICSDFGQIMYTFIIWKLREKIDKVDYILIPQGSNLLLGLDVGKKLGKKVIAIQNEGRIQENVPWDGWFFTDHIKNDRPKHLSKHIIILHDVLVSGTRIRESVQKLPKNSYIIDGFFCLARYDGLGFDPYKELKQGGLSRNICHCILTITKEQLENAMKSEKKGKIK